MVTIMLTQLGQNSGSPEPYYYIEYASNRSKRESILPKCTHNKYIVPKFVQGTHLELMGAKNTSIDPMFLVSIVFYTLFCADRVGLS